MNYNQECLEKFNQLPSNFKNKVGGLETLQKINALEEEYGFDLKFLVVLVAIKELKIQDIPQYLMAKYQIAEEDAYELKIKLLEDVFQPAILVDDTNIYLTSKEEIVNIFRDELVKILKNENDSQRSLINNLNEGIFFWLSKNGLLQNELIKTLLNNQEALTSSRLSFEEREIAPTVAHWLKIFIKQVGNDNLDELMIAQYLSVSPEVKKLGVYEKGLVRKLIRVYYNLAFFPNSLKDVSLNDWTIIPIEKVASDQIKKNLVIVQEVSQEKIKSVDIEAPIKTTGGEKKEEKNEESVLLTELELAIKNYSEKTLEYKVLNQEIKRLKKKK